MVPGSTVGGADAPPMGRRAALGLLASCAAAILLLLKTGLDRDMPAVLPLLALAAPLAAALLLLDASVLLLAGLALLPWAPFINLGEGLPVISFYVFSGLAAVKTLMRPGPKVLTPTLLVLAAYGLYLAGSAFLFGSLAETKSKLFHWGNFCIFVFAISNNARDLPAAARALAVLTASSFANAIFSITLYYVANYAFPSPSVFVERVLFPAGKFIYGSRGFELILNGTNWWTEGGALKALGFFHNPTQTSLYALMNFGLSAFLLLDRKPLVPKGLLVANLAACIAHVILSSGRSGMAVMPILFGVWMFAVVKVTGFRMAARNLVVVVAILVLLGAALGNVLIMNFNSLVSLDYYSNAGRLIAMTSGLTVAAYAGPFGFGFGRTPTVMDMGPAVTGLQQAIGNAIGAVSFNFKSIIADEYYRQTNYHSLYMDMLVQTGWVGFLLFLAVFLNLGWHRAGAHPALRYGSLALALAFLAAQAVGGDIFYPKVMIPLLAVSVLAERMNAREREEGGAPPRNAPPGPATGGG